MIELSNFKPNERSTCDEAMVCLCTIQRTPVPFLVMELHPCGTHKFSSV